jgi:hypothetical protein
MRRPGDELFAHALLKQRRGQQVIAHAIKGPADERRMPPPTPVRLPLSTLMAKLGAVWRVLRGTRSGERL